MPTSRSRRSRRRKWGNGPTGGDPDNRRQLNRRFQGQKSSRARNVVNDLGTNWCEAVEMKPARASGQPQGFDREWLGQNKLEMPAAPVD